MVNYSFSRGCLISKEAEGERIIPPPCLRADIIAQVHQELLHLGWERTFFILWYVWPGMCQEVQAYCKACLSCQLSTGVFRR